LLSNRSQLVDIPGDNFLGQNPKWSFAKIQSKAKSMLGSSRSEIGSIVLVVIACAVLIASVIKILRARKREIEAEMKKQKDYEDWLARSAMVRAPGE
jgi:hypothetical protein